MIEYINDKDRELMKDFKELSSDELETKYKKKYKTLQRKVEHLHTIPDLKPEDLLKLKGKSVLITNWCGKLVDVTFERMSPSGNFVFIKEVIDQDENGDNIYQRSWKRYNFVYDINEVLNSNENIWMN